MLSLRLGWRCTSGFEGSAGGGLLGPFVVSGALNLETVRPVRPVRPLNRGHRPLVAQHEGRREA